MKIKHAFTGLRSRKPRIRNVISVIIVILVAGFVMAVTITPWLGTALYIMAIATLLALAW